LIRIAISSQARLLNVLRGAVKVCARDAGVSASDAEYLTLAIDEAAANVIRHTYCGNCDTRLALEIHSLPDRLEFILEDWGPKVREELIRPRPLDELRPGGLGTFFIYSFMDKCSYDPNFKEGNRLKLVKFLTQKGACNNEGPSAKSG
jgi:anti-sigma regulatory factor (Ser/Thr protein kinase)